MVSSRKLPFLLDVFRTRIASLKGCFWMFNEKGPEREGGGGALSSWIPCQFPPACSRYIVYCFQTLRPVTVYSEEGRPFKHLPGRIKWLPVGAAPISAGYIAVQPSHSPVPKQSAIAPTSPHVCGNCRSLKFCLNRVCLQSALVACLPPVL